tara:strand:- start:841 stop:1119 length:279 start_codon:yes stop_codon:yes gene_type:complete
MNILTEEINQTPAIDFVAKRTKISAKNSFEQLKGIHQQLSSQLWSNPHYSCDEILAELGEEAAQVLSVHKGIGDLLNGFVPDCAECKDAPDA